MKYNVSHKTLYKYAEPVNTYHSVVCLMAKTLPGQTCSNFSLNIVPAPDEIVARRDFFGNTVHYFSIHTPHERLTVEATSIVETFPSSFSLPYSLITCGEAREILNGDLSLKNQHLEFMLTSPFVAWNDDIRNFARDCFPDNQPLYESVRALCNKIFTQFTFVPDFTNIHTPLKTVLKEKKGVCQDFSHLAIACIRSMGFAARYVSGYLETIPLPGKEKLRGSDSSHAWISAFIPGTGWCDFDPTNNIIPQERHIITAWGRDYSDVPPLKGIIFSSGKHTLSVTVDVSATD